MTVNVNNQTKQISDNTSVTQLLQQLEQPENGIAVAVNQKIITRTDWITRTLNNGDDILIIQATQGG